MRRQPRPATVRRQPRPATVRRQPRRATVRRQPRPATVRRQPRRVGRLGVVARVVVGSALLIAVLFLGVFPTRTFLAQRHAIQASRARLAVLKHENSRLRGEVQRLQSDGEIERIARQRFNLAKPGEEVFRIIPSVPGARLAAERGVAAYLQPLLAAWEEAPAGP